MPEELRATLDFLRRLRENNDRRWFEAHRADYAAARGAFQGRVEELILRFGAVDDLGGIGAKDCMFRINRDLRFSKDKTPYKTAMSALLGAGGRKSKSSGRSYYFHIEPDGGSILAGGLYDPTPAELGALREALAKNASPFKKIIGADAFVAFFGELGGDSLKTAPQGYPKDHPDIGLLRLKQYVAVHQLDDGAVLSKDLIPRALEVYSAMKPFLAYLGKVLASRS